MRYQRIKGTRDVLPSEIERVNFVKEKARQIFSLYGYREIRTPILEPTELFVHSTGTTSDIVAKQMYTFTDLGKRSITLRPEGTPGVIRAVIENQLSLPQRLYYIEPMFRQERPQKGRYREFNQIGIEAVGIGSPLIDAEVINIGVELLRSVQIINFVVELNSIGCPICRPAFRSALLKFIKPKVVKFCPDCQMRADRNPLRIFDCKNEVCQQLLSDAPSPVDYLCSECRSHYANVKDYLKFYKIEFVENPRLARGIDYYTRTVFEIKDRHLGAQDTIIGGGRYDYLVKELGGPDAPAIGFALGLERLVQSMTQPEIKSGKMKTFFIIPLSASSLPLAINLQQTIVRKCSISLIG
ncbi:MAG: histidine--tRNA ligase, partial [candidate division WOR-3 bacterium]